MEEISDEQMHVLNVAVPSGLARGVIFPERTDTSAASEIFFAHLVDQIPNYWVILEMDHPTPKIRGATNVSEDVRTLIEDSFHIDLPR